MDFRGELEGLLRQIPEGSMARCGDIARALGDVRASAAVFRFVREHPGVPGAHRVLAGSGPSAATSVFFGDFKGERPLRRLREEQLRIAARVRTKNGFRGLTTIGGVDVAYLGDRGFAALLVVRAKDMAVVEEVLITRQVHFPYIPTYLAYREAPLIVAAVERLGERPTVLLVDGHGQLHPARCGLATFVGVSLDLPTIGVAKNPLVGDLRGRPGVGEHVSILHRGRVLGYALRPSASSRLIYVSAGHRVSLQTARKIVLQTCRTRQPEPLRLAHLHATGWKRRRGKM